MKIILQDNLWFASTGARANYFVNGARTYAVNPRLGLTDSADVDAKRQELAWLQDYTKGNLVIAQQWMRPHTPGAMPGSPGFSRIDRNLTTWVHDVLEPTNLSWSPRRRATVKIRDTRRRRRVGRKPNWQEIKWCIFYDPVLAIRQELNRPGGERFDLANKEYADLIRFHAGYLSKWFDRADYWHIDGRPVLYVWALHGGVENGAPLWEELKRVYNVCILGDVFGGSSKAADGVDIATGFVSVFPGLGTAHKTSTVQAIRPRLIQTYRDWAGRLPTIPAFSLQYDDSRFQRALASAGEYAAPPTKVLARGPEDLRDLFDDARPYAEQSGYVFCGTVNNWPEGTTVAPTKTGLRRAFGTESLGHYGFAHLEAIEEFLSGT